MNLVVLSFVQPMKLLNLITDSQTTMGVPVGMTQDIVNYFTSHNVRVMLSIGGATYTTFWDQALTPTPPSSALTPPILLSPWEWGSKSIRKRHRPQSDRPARLHRCLSLCSSVQSKRRKPRRKVDHRSAAGDRSLVTICRKATSDWLTAARPVLDYANATVPMASRPRRCRSQLAGARGRQDQHQSSDPAASPGQGNRRRAGGNAGTASPNARISSTHSKTAQASSCRPFLRPAPASLQACLDTCSGERGAGARYLRRGCRGRRQELQHPRPHAASATAIRTRRSNVRRDTHDKSCVSARVVVLQRAGRLKYDCSQRLGSPGMSVHGLPVSASFPRFAHRSSPVR